MSKTHIKPHKTKVADFKHHCHWRRAAILLAKCVITTLQADGKIGMGTGLVMRTVDGKRIVERWDKEFIEALAFIGIEVGERRKQPRPARRSAPASSRPASKELATRSTSHGSSRAETRRLP